MTKRFWAIKHKTSKLNGKFNHGISFAELASLGWCGKVCLPGKGDDKREEDGEDGEGVAMSLVQKLRTARARAGKLIVYSLLQDWAESMSVSLLGQLKWFS